MAGVSYGVHRPGCAILQSQNTDSPFLSVLVRDLGDYDATLACKCGLVQEKRNILVKQVPSVPGKDNLFVWSAAFSFLDS